MKKIIATVLAMVMALALCTTAFAATSITYTKAYDEKGNQQSGDSFVVTTVASVKDESIKGYVIGTDDAAKYYIAADAKDYDLKLTADGRSALYLSEAPNNTLEYKNTAKLFKNVGDDCEQLPGDTDDTYYSYTDDDDETTYYVKDSDGNINVLVDGKLVAVFVYNEELNDHNWKAASYDSDNKVATYKCKDCGTVATVYKTKDAAIAAGVGTVLVDDDLGVLGYTYGKTTDTKTDGTSSPKTFDAGIAMYVGMALTSVAGSAVVIGKKKEF